MIQMYRPFWNHVLMSAIIGVLFAATSVHADKTNTAQMNVASLPTNLFVKAVPQNAVAVGEARKTAEEGKAIVIRGRIGGVAKPIADKHAIFMITDLSLALCKDACADFCQLPREQLLNNMATIQVVDSSGRPLRVPIDGINGLKPLAEVVVRGTVAKRDKNFLIVNAQNIFVDSVTK